jgi:hypothetical protein
VALTVIDCGFDCSCVGRSNLPGSRPAALGTFDSPNQAEHIVYCHLKILLSRILREIRLFFHLSPLNVFICAFNCRPDWHFPKNYSLLQCTYRIALLPVRLALPIKMPPAPSPPDCPPSGSCPSLTPSSSAMSAPLVPAVRRGPVAMRPLDMTRGAVRRPRLSMASRRGLEPPIARTRAVGSHRLNWREVWCRCMKMAASDGSGQARASVSDASRGRSA